MQILTLTHQGQMTLNKNGLDGKGFYGKFYISVRISIARKMGFLKDPLLVLFSLGKRGSSRIHYWSIPFYTFVPNVVKNVDEV